MERIRTIFLGTSWQSLEILKTLCEDSRFEIVGIVTQEDKPVGRKQVLTPSEVKQFGLDNNIPVITTNGSKEIYDEAIKQFSPELNVCIAFGEIVPESFLNAPMYGSINIHFSILPKYRGAIPIQMAILNGERETGISIMKMDGGMDTGDILSIYKEGIREDDTNLSLRERLVEKSKELLPDILLKWVNGDIQPMKQDSSKATYCYKKDLTKEKAEIDFTNMDAEYIDKLVRATIPWPVAWAILDSKRVKIYKVRVLDVFNDLRPSERLTDRLRLIYGTKNKQIEILELQPEGKKPMSAIQYLSGRN